MPELQHEQYPRPPPLVAPGSASRLAGRRAVVAPEGSEEIRVALAADGQRRRVGAVLAGWAAGCLPGVLPALVDVVATVYLFSRPVQPAQSTVQRSSCLLKAMMPCWSRLPFDHPPSGPCPAAAAVERR